ncbi:MAG: FtsX-like permease family protein [Pseudomonadales bacterium]|nr:FtsX-like permease family protein [Pseudomonadales bacterium]
MKALDLKLLRELWRLRMQMLSITLVVATGIMSVMTMRGTYDSLILAQQNYYAQTRFADLWVSLVRAPLAVATRLGKVAGVDVVDTRVSFLATLDLPGVDMPAQGRFVSLPSHDRPVLNDIVIRQGRYITPGLSSEVIINEKFAQARHLGPGDSVKVILNGLARSLDIVGIANSPEHSYAVAPGSLLPEDERYGVFWMNRESLGPAFDMEGAFNEAVFRLSPNANADAVLKVIDKILTPYGGLGSYLRKDQLSHQILDNELAEIRVMGTVIPAIFLGVAVFLLHLVLGRLIATQRDEIAALKAFGYRNREVGRHFLLFAMTAVIAGALIGAIGGIVLGTHLIKLYAQYFDIPDLQYHVAPYLLLLAVTVTLAGACTGAMAAVREAVNLPPAEAIRPPVPLSFKPGPLERLGLGSVLPASGRMILRNMERRPLQALLSAVGIALSVAILVTGMFMFDSINYMVDLQFRVIQREDISLVFKQDMPDSVHFDLAHLEGVTTVETYRQVPARLHKGHREETTAVIGQQAGARLRRIIDSDGREVPLPMQGMVISALLAKRLGVSPGELLKVEWLAGKKGFVDVRVSAIVKDFIGVAAYLDQQTLGRLTGEPVLVSGAYLSVAEASKEALYAHLKQIPGVAGVASPQSMLASFEREMTQSLLLASSFLLGFASVIAVGVIYNGARISLSERGHELASLRVMGFHRREVAVLLLGEQAIITALSIPLGCVMGYLLARSIAANIETDTFRIAFVTEAHTYLFAALVVVAAALASGLAVRRRLDHIDLIDVLKSRE